MEKPFSIEWFLNPIRLGGVLSIFFLAGPGTLEGVSLLLVYSGESPVIPLVAARTHALLQLAGFFMLLIWGFLTHAFPGLLSADLKSTERIRYPIILHAIALGALWIAEAAGAGWTVRHAIFAADLLFVVVGTLTLMNALRTAKRSWREMPFPFLVIPLVLFPIAFAVSWWEAATGTTTSIGSELLLLAVVMPIVLTMCFRMFAPMMGAHPPHERPFRIASALWAGAIVLRVAGGMAVIESAAWLGATVLFVYSMRAFEKRRSRLGRQEVRFSQLSLDAQIAVGQACLPLGALVMLLVSVDALPGSGRYWNDYARHLWAIGFSLITVAGITQRVFPNFLRGKQSSSAWTWVNFALLTAGLLLRAGEPFLPSSAYVVRASAWITWLGVFGLSAHLLRAMFFRSRTVKPAGVVGIRRPQAAG